MASLGLTILILCVLFVLPMRSQDMECTSALLCNQIVLNHSVQIKTHCVYLNILFTNMSEETLAVGIFRLCRKTLILDMSNNNIKFIKAGAFLGLTALKELYLANNLVERIEPGTFHTLTNLEVFVLTGNRLKTLPEYEFTSKSLRYFNINHNEIRKLPDTAMLNLRDIGLVDLSLNNLEEISPTALCNVIPGAKIILNNNQLLNIAMKFNITTPKAQSLKYSVLEASGNVIKQLSNKSLGDFYKLRLVTLDLGFNFIADIDVETFDRYSTLRAIHLGHNRIQILPNDLFRKLVNLNMLDLSYNQLTTHVFELRLPDTVTSLNYSNNRIEEFKDYHWSAKIKRKYIRLDISNNTISYIDPNRFCKFINVVKLVYNEWSCNVLYSILRNMEMRKVHVESGYDYRSDNVNGIPCKMGVSKLLDSKLEEVKNVLNKPVVTTLTNTSLESNATSMRYFENNTLIDDSVDQPDLVALQSSIASHLQPDGFYVFILMLLIGRVNN